MRFIHSRSNVVARGGKRAASPHTVNTDCITPLYCSLPGGRRRPTGRRKLLSSPRPQDPMICWTAAIKFEATAAAAASTFAGQLPSVKFPLTRVVCQRWPRANWSFVWYQRRSATMAFERIFRGSAAAAGGAGKRHQRAVLQYAANNNTKTKCGYVSSTTTSAAFREWHEKV